MAKQLSTTDIQGAIALGKRTGGIMLPTVNITATPMKKGDDIYHIGNVQASHDDIVSAFPKNVQPDVHNYLNTFRQLKGGTETVNGKPDTANNHYILNSAATKNDMYDMVNRAAQAAQAK